MLDIRVLQGFPSPLDTKAEVSIQSLKEMIRRNKRQLIHLRNNQNQRKKKNNLHLISPTIPLHFDSAPEANTNFHIPSSKTKFVNSEPSQIDSLTFHDSTLASVFQSFAGSSNSDEWPCLPNNSSKKHLVGACTCLPNVVDQSFIARMESLTSNFKTFDKVATVGIDVVMNSE